MSVTSILGIANLIGGLALIFQNIADRDIRDMNEEKNEKVGHYWLKLRRWSKARLHMVGIWVTSTSALRVVVPREQ